MNARRNAAAKALLGMLIAVAGALTLSNSALAEETSVSYEEYEVPQNVELPVGARSPVRLVDDLTGLDVPLAGSGETTNGDRLSISIPQLPPGKFTASWPGGELHIEVLDEKGTRFAYASRGEDGDPLPYHLLVLATGGAGAIWLTARRKKKAAFLVVAGSLMLGSATWLLGTETKPVYGQAAWDACGLEQKEEIKLNCKVETLLDHIESGRFAELRELVAANRDPACHEVTHRASFHTWRLTRDKNLAKSLLIPGCDDGLIHGIAESMATFTSDDKLATEILDFCTGAEEDFQMRACLHGGGHATIWRTNGDILRAWEICKEIPTDAVADYNASEECMGSSVMEWSDRWSAGARKGTSTVTPKMSEPMELCPAGPTSYTFRLGCYLGTNHRTGDAGRAAQWCIDKEQHVQLDACFAALGENLPYYEAPYLTIELVPEMAINHARNCELAPVESARDACMTAMSRVFVVMKVSKTLGQQVCDAVSPALQKACLAGIREAELKFEQRGLELS